MEVVRPEVWWKIVCLLCNRSYFVFLVTFFCQLCVWLAYIVHGFHLLLFSIRIFQIVCITFWINLSDCI